jgi:hypothetical protein
MRSGNVVKGDVREEFRQPHRSILPAIIVDRM